MITMIILDFSVTRAKSRSETEKLLGLSLEFFFVTLIFTTQVLIKIIDLFPLNNTSSERVRVSMNIPTQMILVFRAINVIISKDL